MTSLRRASLVGLGLCLWAGTASAQGAPRRLFPDLPPPPAAPAVEPGWPEPVVEATPLAPPALAALGLPEPRLGLNGELWEDDADAGLSARLARLPERIDDPVLWRLQRALLVAPGPAGADDASIAVRGRRLIAMGAADEATSLLDLVPPARRTAEIEEVRLAALLAGDEIDRACPLALDPAHDGPSWRAARVTCAAIAGDRPRAELLLELARDRGQALPALLAELVRALGGTRRLRLREMPPDAPALLPLLRRSPVEPAQAVIADAPPLIRRALALNVNVPPGLRPQVAELDLEDASPGLPGLDGRTPDDWGAALGALPAALRPRWLAAVDALGAKVPEAVWDRLPAAARAEPPPPLAAARALAHAKGRGETLLAVLLLLDGRPAAASPATLSAAIDALRRIGLDDEARRLAATALGAAAG